MVAQLFMMVIMLVLAILPSNILRITPKSLNLDKSNVMVIIKLSLHVFIGRFLFHFGKVYLNSIASAHYGKQVVGALGISNTMAGLPTNIINSFEDGGSTIVSQNYGNQNGKRILKFYLCNMLLVGSDEDYRVIISNIFKWECLDIAFTGLSGASNALFYGFGKTKITSFMSMLNLFGFRLPTIMILMYVVDMNYEACGIAMFVSNTLAGIITSVWCLYFVIHLKKNHKYEDLFRPHEGL